MKGGNGCWVEGRPKKDNCFSRALTPHRPNKKCNVKEAQRLLRMNHVDSGWFVDATHNPFTSRSAVAAVYVDQSGVVGCLAFTATYKSSGAAEKAAAMIAAANSEDELIFTDMLGNAVKFRQCIYVKRRFNRLAHSIAAQAYKQGSISQFKRVGEIPAVITNCPQIRFKECSYETSQLEQEVNDGSG